MEKGKNNKKKKISIAAISVVLAIIASIISICTDFFGLATTWKKNATQNVKGDNNQIVAGDYIYNDNSVYEIIVTSHNSDSADDLRQAEIFIRQNDYESALAIYEKNINSSNPVALINAGYIYANGLSRNGKDYQIAANYYIQANCREAFYNLFALFLRTNDTQNARQLLEEFLDNEDPIIHQYINACFEKAGIERANKNMHVEEIIDSLLQWRETSQHYSGYNPPSDTEISKWVISGINFKGNTPIQEYIEYKQVYDFSISDIEKMYFMEGNTFVPIE